MNKFERLLPILLFQVFSVSLSFAQTSPQTNASQAAGYAVSLYYQSLGEQAGVYNGLEYIGYPYPLKYGHQYLESTESTNGSVFYDGLLYKNVPLWYDIVKDELIVLHPNNSRILLHKEKVESFSIYDHNYINIQKAKADSVGLKPGYYGQLYSGRSEILSRKIKGSVQVASKGEGLRILILNQKNYYYVRDGGKYRAIGSKGSLMKVFKDKQKEIDAWLKNNNINYKKDPEGAMAKTAAYYDQLK